LHTLTFTRRYFAVDRRDIAYLRFIVESYDGLATLSTVDAANGIISLSFPGCFAEEVSQLVQALKTETTIADIACPDGYGTLLEHHEGREQN
jgi:hypothetical protein